MESAFVTAIIAFIKALLGIKTKDPEVVEAKANEAQAEKATAVFAAPDRDRATVDDILLKHADQ